MGLPHVLRGAAVALFFLSCSSNGASSSSSSSGTASTAPAPGETGLPTAKPDGTQLFAPAVKNIQVEIDYAPGAEPFVGAAGRYPDVWGLFRTNANAIFDGQKTVTNPSKIADMEKLDDVTATQFTQKDILAIAAKHRSGVNTADTFTYYVVFLNGKLVDDSGAVQVDTMSVSIGATAVIAMFKPVIPPSGLPKSPVAQLVEQASLIHQFGHAVGFVDNGIPQAASNAHLDAAHGQHCTNAKCIMSWQMESTKGVVDFASNYIIANDPVIYGQECLSDARLLENSLLSP